MHLKSSFFNLSSICLSIYQSIYLYIFKLSVWYSIHRSVKLASIFYYLLFSMYIFNIHILCLFSVNIYLQIYSWAPKCIYYWLLYRPNLFVCTRTPITPSPLPSPLTVLQSLVCCLISTVKKWELQMDFMNSFIGFHGSVTVLRLLAGGLVRQSVSWSVRLS